MEFQVGYYKERYGYYLKNANEGKIKHEKA